MRRAGPDPDSVTIVSRRLSRRVARNDSATTQGGLISSAPDLTIGRAPGRKTSWALSNQSDTPGRTPTEVNFPMDVSRRAASLLLLVVLIATAALRYRLLGVPLERDEGEYAYVGWLMLQGVPPYAEAYTMKLPGIHAAYAGILALFGHSP